MLYQRSHSQHDNGVIFLGVDESNYLLDADYEGQANKRSFLKETMIAVASTLLSDIVPVVELSYITISNNTICKDSPDPSNVHQFRLCGCIDVDYGIRIEYYTGTGCK